MLSSQKFVMTQTAAQFFDRYLFPDLFHIATGRQAVRLTTLFVFVAFSLVLFNTLFSHPALALVDLEKIGQGQTLLGADIPSAPSQNGAVYKIITDTTGQPTIQVTGAGASITLNDVKNALAAADANKLINQGNSIWRLNANLLIGAGVTLTVSPGTGVQELQMRSESNTVQISPTIAYSTFVYLRAVDGAINIEGSKLYSWDAQANKVDEYYDNGRAYILAKFAATLNIRNAEISYLGANENESFGLSWRDQNLPGAPNDLRTRVTGEVISSNIHHNYYGIYTYQAANMTFRDNQFHHNVRYGFDPHDFSHHFVIENNHAYENGSHGFILSRGCNNMILRNNKAYGNLDPSTNRAHGFMLDPGGVSSIIPQAPSTDNLLEKNEAYDNEGFGLRILGSHRNRILNNYFHDNYLGLGLSGGEQNLIEENRIIHNTTQGVELLSGSRANSFRSNAVTTNGTHGIDIEDGSSQNIFLQNIIRENLVTGIKADGMFTIGNLWSQNSIYANWGSGLALSNSANQNIVAPILSTVTNSQLTGKTLIGGVVEIYSDGGTQGQYYEGVTIADGEGNFSFANTGNWQAQQLTALVRDGQSNTSIFAVSLPAPGPFATWTPTPLVTPTPTITPTPPETPTPTPTNTPVETATPTPTLTLEPTATKLASPTPTLTETPIGVGLNQFVYLPAVTR